jgi:hypothetical protein
MNGQLGYIGLSEWICASHTAAMKLKHPIPFATESSTRGRLSGLLACAVVAFGMTGNTAVAQLPDVVPSPAKTLVGSAAPEPAITPLKPVSEDEGQAPVPEAVSGVKYAAGLVKLLKGDTFSIRPPARRPHIPRTRWQHMEGHSLWTRAALSALKSHGSPLVEMVLRDISNWCPAYASNDDAKRRAFWVGYMSALAKHESTYKPWAVGGGGKWYGLLQILPATARGYKCNVGTGEALKNGAANLSCGVRIMAFTVKRDGVIHGRDNKWRGVSADWGPMRNGAKRRDMAGWLKRQEYCTLVNSTRPRTRP